MTEREKVQKAFNQCTDALSNLDQKSIMKVFRLLSVQFDIVPVTSNNDGQINNENHAPQMNYLPKVDNIEANEVSNETQLKDNKRSNSSKKGKSGSNKAPTFLPDFDFRPEGKISLKDFHSQYKASTSMENNLVFSYYLQEILNEQISSDHIYSCYRHLGLKIPSFPSTINDTKRAKGWLDTSNYNDIKVTRAGINHIEHEMVRSNGE